MDSVGKLAFALGGLAGNNAHGAGFLQAAIEKNVEPDLISCTSGQIFWVYTYLIQKENGEDLRQVLEEMIDHTETTHNPDMDLMILAMLGKRGFFKPAYLEFMTDFFRNTWDSYLRIANNLVHHKNTFLLREFLSMLPARVIIPKFPDDLFEKISQAFNEAKIGIVFNSYNPQAGTEYIYLNQAARNLLKIKQKSRKHSYRVRTEYKEITAEAVRAGLWLYQYGFDDHHKILDGAYYRQIMLSELVVADKIYVVRPINFRWLGDLPKSYMEVEDLKLETAFNGSYVGERDKIDLINKFLKQGVIKETIIKQKGYHPIELIELEIDTQEDFLDYIFEKMSVFDQARAQAMLYFERVEEPIVD